MTDLHTRIRQRHALVGRSVQVVAIEAPTPGVRRIHFESPALADFHSPGPDDHVAIFVPSPDGEAIKRHYTPRFFDRERCRLTIDFALHDGGPATHWARNAKTGDSIEIGGPRSSLIVSDDFDWYLLLGDETAVPAIARRVEGLRAGVPVLTSIVIRDSLERQYFETRATWSPAWLERGHAGPADAELLLAKVRDLPLPAGDGFVWIGGEANLAHALRAFFLARGQPAAWLHAAAYWRRGTADVHEVLGEE